ncbi:MAG TPA: leucyl/phenylalanyl-tRNA--protein transferase [Rhodanobacteraceae bacterium]|nr:leucyl/phenylalanyl-tRNA--protein transferase [Rhodanobacteraceae bacterium]
MNPLPIAVLAAGSPPTFPHPSRALTDPNGLLAAGGDLSPERLLAAYRHGIFPWFSRGEPILWWSPDPRCVFRTKAIHVSRSLRKQLARSNWTLSADRAFADVMRACAAPRSDGHGTWISPAMHAAYVALHHLGHAHSVEVWDGSALVGGIYGVAVGRLLAGESMFSRESGGSKAALLALARTLHGWGFPLLDAQVPNPHLQSLGATALPRQDFLQQLARLVEQPGPSGHWGEIFPLHRARALAD